MSIFNYLEKHAKENPNYIAITSSEEKWSYKDLYNIVAQNQRELGFKKNQKIILKVRNSVEYIISFLALLSKELWVIPVSPDTNSYELEKIMKLTEAALVIDEKNNPVQIKTNSSRCYLYIPEGNNGGIYHMTSGSTGEPKFCIRTIKNLTNEGESYKNTLHIDNDDKILNLPPLYHSYAQGASLISSIVAGATICPVDNMAPRKILKVIASEKPTIMILVPFMAKILAASYSKENYDVSSLRIVLAGAGRITREVYQLFKEKFGISLMSNYGSTETGGLITRLTDEPFDSIGKPMINVEFKLVNKLGNPVMPGEEGGIWVKTSSMLQGYLNKIPLNLDLDGFFNMNDICVQDLQGNIYIKQRKKSIISIAGKKVSTAEVEEVLSSYPGIRDCVVLSFKMSNGNEAIRAIISTIKAITEQEIREYCHSRLSDYKIPTKIEFWPIIPRNELGKIKYELIKESKI